MDHHDSQYNQDSQDSSGGEDYPSGSFPQSDPRSAQSPQAKGKQIIASTFGDPRRLMEDWRVESLMRLVGNGGRDKEKEILREKKRGGWANKMNISKAHVRKKKRESRATRRKEKGEEKRKKKGGGGGGGSDALYFFVVLIEVWMKALLFLKRNIVRSRLHQKKSSRQPCYFIYKTLYTCPSSTK